MKQIYIGDVHGKYQRYKTIMKKHTNTIQLGDMGVGFFKFDLNRDVKPEANPHYDYMKRGNHRFIRGNHDNPQVCKKHSQFINDGYTENGMMFIGSASSTDIDKRIEYMDWWKDEELSTDEINHILTLYENYKPDVMVTHDCPESIAKLMARYQKKKNYSNRLRLGFEEMLHIHQPKIWIFGHWHQSLNITVDKTNFICLKELEIKEIEY